MTTRIPRARRIGRNPLPCDPALALIDARVTALIALKSVVITSEYAALANLIAQEDAWTAANPSIDPDSRMVSFYMYQSKLNRWADPRMLRLVEGAEALDPDESKMGENRDSQSREYEWTWKFTDGSRLKLTLSAYEDKDTSECRRIQVGTKTVEVPVYRTDCVVPEGNAGELPAPVLALDL